MEEQILELTRQVTILNERLPNHINWTERNVMDHEKRLRLLEQKVWLYTGIALAAGTASSFVIQAIGA